MRYFLLWLLFSILDLNKIISPFKDARAVCFRSEVILTAVFVFRHVSEELG